MNTPRDVKQRLSAARAALVLDHPFFGALALRMSFQEEVQGRTRTLATDGRSIYYDKAYVKTCSDEELVGLLAHEVMHPALQHHTRRGGRDPKLWNEAGDYAINPILTEAGLVLPQGVLSDPRFAGLSSEQIYEQLARDAQESQGDITPPSAAGSHGQDNAGGGEGSTNDDNQAAQPPGSAGSERDNSLADLPGAVFDAPEGAQAEAEWQVAVRQAAQAARMMGNLPGALAIAVEEVTQPRIDWKAVLRRFVQQCASHDYSWRMPNRRYLASGIYLPEIRSEAMPAIVVVVDTSGSTLDVLPAFKAEMQSIVDECQPEETIVVMADAAVRRVDRFARHEPIEFNVEGLGGTDFRPAFEYVEREQLNPACLIYLTDGVGTFPCDSSSYPTLWAITIPHVQAPWGETVHLAPHAGP